MWRGGRRHYRESPTKLGRRLAIPRRSSNTVVARRTPERDNVVDSTTALTPVPLLFSRLCQRPVILDCMARRGKGHTAPRKPAQSEGLRLICAGSADTQQPSLEIVVLGIFQLQYPYTLPRGSQTARSCRMQSLTSTSSRAAAGAFPPCLILILRRMLVNYPFMLRSRGLALCGSRQPMSSATRCAGSMYYAFLR